MTSTLILLVAFVLLCAVLYFEKTENRAGLVPTKGCLSVLFILAAVVQKDPLNPYFAFVVTGLVFCLGGDVFLALPQEKAFMLRSRKTAYISWPPAEARGFAVNAA